MLPSATLGLLLSGVFANALRLNLRRTLDSDYVEAARSRGLSERRVVLRHALPNALLPVLTITGITVASLIGGALLIEWGEDGRITMTGPATESFRGTFDWGDFA